MKIKPRLELFVEEEDRSFDHPLSLFIRIRFWDDLDEDIAMALWNALVNSKLIVDGKDISCSFRMTSRIIASLMADKYDEKYYDLQETLRVLKSKTELMGLSMKDSPLWVQTDTHNVYEFNSNAPQELKDQYHREEQETMEEYKAGAKYDYMSYYCCPYSKSKLKYVQKKLREYADEYISET